MMFGDFRTADRLAIRFSAIDYRCRNELNSNIIISERDYVSALSTRIRDEIGKRYRIPCHSQTVSSKMEREGGVDGIILFKFQDRIKVGLFEAKRPQIFNPRTSSLILDTNWDIKTSRGTSHFSEQIQNQRKWGDGIAIWEMFFNDGPDGFESPPFNHFGSSCVWHENAFNFMNSNGLIFEKWTTRDLRGLLKNHSISFYAVIFDILSCQAGKLWKVEGEGENQTVKVFGSNNENNIMEIPIPSEYSNERDGRIEEFLIQNNLVNYTLLNFDQLKNGI